MKKFHPYFLLIFCSLSLSCKSFYENKEKKFNSDISNWDTSSVTMMNSMFCYAASFNQPVGDWNTSNVTNMYFTFASAYAFNQYIGNWDVSSVTNMGGMFDGARDYNQDMTKWCVSQFSSEPSGFSLNNSISNSNKPIWGTCPAPIVFENGTCKCPCLLYTSPSPRD